MSLLCVLSKSCLEMRHFKKNLFKELAVSLLLFTGFLFSASLMSAPAWAARAGGGDGTQPGDGSGEAKAGAPPARGLVLLASGKVGCSRPTPQGGHLTEACGG